MSNPRTIQCFCAVHQRWRLAQRVSLGSLKYMHHFGLGRFSTRGEHWNLQASLAHSSNELFPLSLASALEFAASAMATNDLRGTDFVRDKMCPVGAASLIGFFSVEISVLRASRELARGRASSHFILLPFMDQAHTSSRIMPPTQAVKEKDLRGGLLIC